MKIGDRTASRRRINPAESPSNVQRAGYLGGINASLLLNTLILWYVQVNGYILSSGGVHAASMLCMRDDSLLPRILFTWAHL